MRSDAGKGVESIRDRRDDSSEESAGLAKLRQEVATELGERIAAAERRGAQAVFDAVVSPDVLETMRWRLEHYGPIDAEPFQYSRFASPAHAAFSAAEEAARAAIARAESERARRDELSRGEGNSSGLTVSETETVTQHTGAVGE